MDAARQRLIDEYLESLAAVRRALRAANRRSDPRARVDRGHVAGMERDLLWTIEYLESGHPPDYHRGAYKRMVPVDPSKLRCMVKARQSHGGLEWRSFEAEVNELLSVLAPREKEAFVLVRGQGCTYDEAAKCMGLTSSGTVSAAVRRAERKVRKTSGRAHVTH